MEPKPQAPSADIERLTSLLRDILQTSGYTRRHPANSREPILRRLVRRMALTASDAPVWTGILRQMQHALGRRTETDSSSNASHSEDGSYLP